MKIVTTEKQRKQMAEYYEANKEKILTQRKPYYKAKKNEINARNRAYHKTHRAEIKVQRKDYHKKYYQENKERLKAQSNAYRQTPAGKRAQRKGVKIYRGKHPERVFAHKEVRNALRNGTLTKQPCQFCGRIKVEAHHPDYSKPLEVIWACREHHKEMEAKKCA